MPQWKGRERTDAAVNHLYIQHCALTGALFPRVLFTRTMEQQMVMLNRNEVEHLHQDGYPC